MWWCGLRRECAVIAPRLVVRPPSWVGGGCARLVMRSPHTPPDCPQAQPIGANETCEHPFLTPNNARTECVLPGRFDIGRHFLMRGGVEGLKESYDSMLARIQSFGRYMFNPREFPAVADLFESEKFQTAAKSVCPPEKRVLDPFQVRGCVPVTVTVTVVVAVAV